MKKVYDIGMYGNALDYLQFLIYRMNSCKDLLSDILIDKTPKYKYTIDNYHHFMVEYKDTKTKYEFEYLDFLMNYLPEYFGLRDCDVDFDFVDGKITFEDKINKNELIETVELENSEEIDLLYHLSIDKSVFDEILNSVIINRKSNYALNMEIYNEFIKEYNEITNQYNSLFYKILADYAPEYKSDDYYAIIDINHLKLDVYKEERV